MAAPSPTPPDRDRPEADRPKVDPLDAPGAGTLAVLLAGGRAAGLHELTEAEPVAALPLAGRRRVVDFPLAEVARAGLGRVIVAVQHRPETLARHLARAGVALRDGRRMLGRVEGARGPAEAVACNAAEIDAAGVARVVVVAADRVGALDLAALVADHRAGGAAATAAEGASGEDLGLQVYDWTWLRGVLAGLEPDAGAAALLARAAAAGERRAWRPGPTWRARIDSLDAFREAHLALAEAAPIPLPEEAEGPPDGAAPRSLAFEAGGLRLSAPRLGARRPGRWTLLEETAVMPGARIADGARLVRAVIAPGAIVPSGLVVGEDPVEDARWFRVTILGTTLVTSAMLARRAAERMRLHALAVRPAPGPLPGHD